MVYVCKLLLYLSYPLVSEIPSATNRLLNLTTRLVWVDLGLFKHSNSHVVFILICLSTIISEYFNENSVNHKTAIRTFLLEFRQRLISRLIYFVG